MLSTQVINDAAGAYKGVIPGDCWHEWYMSKCHLRHEIGSGVMFWGYEEGGELAGVMGIQHVLDVTLMRHAYARTAMRNRCIGGKLLAFLSGMTDRSVIIGTWAAAAWAVRFYQKHGFKPAAMNEKDRLLRTYWSIPERQTQRPRWSLLIKDGLYASPMGHAADDIFTARVTSHHERF